MLIILSPSKKLDFDTQIKGSIQSPDFIEDSKELIKILRKLPSKEISKLMDLSDKLAELNHERYQQFSTPFTKDNARQAIFAFKGDVYDGLEAENFSNENLKFAEKHLRIISGLYGILKPTDLIQPYRLEMGTKLSNGRGKNLYDFWGDKITEKLNNVMANENSKILINLASSEYFKAVKPKKINGRIITPVFKENKKGKLSIVMLFAKRARGMMAQYIIKNNIKNPDDIKNFKTDGYKFNPSLSTENEWIFVRG